MNAVNKRYDIRLDDLQGPEIIALLEEHLRSLEPTAPKESRHALNLDGLRKPEVTFWSVWSGRDIAGCGALLKLDSTHAEVKSMRTAAAFLRQGVAAELLQHILAEAKRIGYGRLSLETGSMAFFEPARSLYQKFGFKECRPFAAYVDDPNSIFMTLEL